MSLHCPKCGYGELHPTQPNKVMIRAYKVNECDGHGWWSQCLFCSGFYHMINGKLVETPDRHQGGRGWFPEFKTGEDYVSYRLG